MDGEEKKFRVILLGLAGPREAFVENMAAFGVERDRLEKYLERMPVVLRRGLDRASAEKYRKALEKAGARLRVEEEPPEPADEPIELPSLEPEISSRPDLTRMWLILGGVVFLAAVALFLLYPRSHRLTLSLAAGDKALYDYTTETVSSFFKKGSSTPAAKVVLKGGMKLFQEVVSHRGDLLEMKVTVENVDLGLEVKSRRFVDHSLVDRQLRDTEEALEGYVFTYRVDRRGRLRSDSRKTRHTGPAAQLVRLIERALLGIELPGEPVKVGQWWTSKMTGGRFLFMELKSIETYGGKRCALIEVATRKSPLFNDSEQTDDGRVSSEVRVNGKVYLDMDTGRVVFMDSEMTSVQKKDPGEGGSPGLVVLTEGSVRLELL